LLTRPIGQSATQNAALQGEIAAARRAGATDFRVNQQQVNAAGQRVGTNRPDLQYTDANGRRVYVEYDTSTSTRGPGHQTRIEANDPNGRVILRVVEWCQVCFMMIGTLRLQRKSDSLSAMRRQQQQHFRNGNYPFNRAEEFVSTGKS